MKKSYRESCHAVMRSGMLSPVRHLFGGDRLHNYVTRSFTFSQACLPAINGALKKLEPVSSSPVPFHCKMEADISLQWLRQQESWREFGCSVGIFKEQGTQFEDDNELLVRFPLGVCTPVGH